MTWNFSTSKFDRPRTRPSDKHNLVAAVAALVLTGILGTSALAAPRGGGAGFVGGHIGHERGAPFFNGVPSNQGPIFNPSSPSTMPTTPETPVSPASPGSVFGNG
jgi:hypothetical protein